MIGCIGHDGDCCKGREQEKKDAERYRWLRKFLSTKDMSILLGRGTRDEPDERDAIDTAIDAHL